MKRYTDTVLEPGTGLALAGGTITVYEADGTTLATLYETNSTSGAALANPVTTDHQGMFWFYVADGTYQLVVEANGFPATTIPDVEIYDLDELVAATAAATAKALTVAILKDVAAPTNDQVIELLQDGRDGTFVFSSANMSARVAADPFEGLYIAPNSVPDGSAGAWVRKHNRIGLATWFGVVAGDGLDHGPRLTSAGEFVTQGTLTRIEAPAGTITTASSIVCNRLVGAGKCRTIFKALASFDRRTVTNGVVVSTEPASDVYWSDFTVDANKVGLGLGDDERIQPMMMRTVTGGTSERTRALNGTGYGHFGRLSNGLVYNDCEAYNCQYAFEQLGTNDAYHANCRAGDGDGDIPVSGYFHCAAGSNDITWDGCVGEGAANNGVDVTSDAAPSNNIRFINGRIITTSGGSAIIFQGANPITGVDLSGSKFYSQNGQSAFYSVTSVSGEADRAKFYGRGRGINHLAGGTFAFTNSFAEGRLPEVPGNATIGVFTIGAGKITWNGGGISSVGGSGDEYISSGNVVISELTVLDPAPGGRVAAVALALATGWTTVSGYRPAAYRKTRDGQVFLEGFVVGSATAGRIIATLPVGARPSNFIALMVRNSTSTIGFVTISSAGVITLEQGSTTGSATLDGQSFWL